MTWGLMQPASPVPPAGSPFSRMTIDRDGGWGYKTKGSNNAALSALALISFLFFLNLLQQQLSAGQPQTLLFMVNNTGRRKRDVDKAQFVAEKQASPGRDQEGANGDESETEEKRSASSPTLPRLFSPAPAPAPPPAVVAWMQGLLPASELPSGLASDLQECRAEVACALHQARQPGQRPLDDNVVKGILSAAGELQAGDGLDAACEALLGEARGQCSQLAHSFAELLPTLEQTTQIPKHLKHDPHDLL